MNPIIILKPSKIHGIGVFTLDDINKNEMVELWGGRDCKFVSDKRKKIICKNPKMDFLFQRYCVKSKRGWWCPLDFIKMSVVWYINHSNEPNLESPDDGYKYYATRKIKSGEELTINYKSLNSDIDNSIMEEK